MKRWGPPIELVRHLYCCRYNAERLVCYCTALLYSWADCRHVWVAHDHRLSFGTMATGEAKQNKTHNLQCNFDKPQSRIQHTMANHLVQPHWFRCQIKSPASKAIKTLYRPINSWNIFSVQFGCICTSTSAEIKFNTNYIHFPFFFIVASSMKMKKKKVCKMV